MSERPIPKRMIDRVFRWRSSIIWFVLGILLIALGIYVGDKTHCVPLAIGIVVVALCSWGFAGYCHDNYWQIGEN